MDDRERLHEIIERRSLRVGGSFKLASGRTSSVYLNLKPTMLDPDGARLIGAALAGKAQALGADYVGGLEMGAVPLVAVTAAMSAVAGKPIKAVFVRKQAKDHGTQSLVEGLAEGESLQGKNVVVVEDVTTTGGSSLKAVAALRAAGATVKHVVTVVDREEGATEAFAAEGRYAPRAPPEARVHRRDLRRLLRRLQISPLCASEARNLLAAIGRIEDDTRAAEQVLDREITELREAAVGRIVPVVAHDEDVVRGDDIGAGILLRRGIGADEDTMRAPAWQHFVVFG